MKILSHTPVIIIESKNRVGGEEIFVVWIGVQVWRAWDEDEGKSVVVFSVTTIWVKGPEGWSWTSSWTELEDELWFRNPGLNYWLACSEELTCWGWDTDVTWEGAATFRGCTKVVESSKKEERFLEAIDLSKEHFLLPRFLNAITKDIFECVALRWNGCSTGWMIKSVQVFEAICKLGVCCRGHSEVTSLEAILEAL